MSKIKKDQYTIPALSELSDVSIDGSQSNGQVLTWNSGSGAWLPKTVISGSSGGNGGQVLRRTNGGVVILAGYCLIVSCDYEVESGDVLEIEDNGLLEVT